MNSPEVGRVIAQTERLHDAFRGQGFLAEVITNPNDEALGVVLRGAFDPDTVAYSAAVDRVRSAESYDTAAVMALRYAFPLSGPRVYPKHFLDIVDLAARTAAGTSGVTEGLATELKSPGQDDTTAGTKRGDGIGLHADYVGGNSTLESGLPLHGLNVHATRWGSAVARFGIVRNLADDTELYEVQGIAERSGDRTIRDAAYERLAAPYTDPIQLNPGDVLIFQAQQHDERGIAATAHDFATITDTRRSDVFRPLLGNTAVVQAQRDELAMWYQLQAWGYRS